MKRIGLLTGLLVLINVLPLEGALQFDRAAIARGELWRLFTGNLVHFSTAHFLLDLSVILMTGWFVRRRLWWTVLVGGWAIGAGQFFLAPEIDIYRGLSGISVALTAMLVARGCTGPDRGFSIGLGILLTLKLLWEMSGGVFLGTALEIGNMGEAAPLAHLIGALTGLAGAFLSGEGSKGSSGSVKKAFPAPEMM